MTPQVGDKIAFVEVYEIVKPVDDKWLMRDWRGNEKLMQVDPDAGEQYEKALELAKTIKPMNLL